MNVRARVSALAVAVLAAGMLASPASAADPATVFVAHGIPGVKVDVCVNGAEVKSDFRYGHWFKASLPAGSYQIKVRIAKPGICTGLAVISKTVTLTDGLNATAIARLVGTIPNLKVFVNDINVPDGNTATATVRHTAVAPKVDVFVNGGTPAITGLAHGDSVGPVPLAKGVYSFWAALQGHYQPVIGPIVKNLVGGRAYQIFAVGNQLRNYRFIVIGQDGIAP